MSVLVTGGAGYIGSHCTKKLIELGMDVVVVDNLETGYLAAVDEQATFYLGDIRDYDFLNEVFQKESIDGVIHFAANSLVGESMINPLKYFNNNVYGTQVLLDVMVEHNVKKIVFSSTAATYGEPKEVPITETAETLPTNTYGETKLAMEKMMKWCDQAHNIKYVSLRYFNVGGAWEDGSIGESHQPETHLIPLILQVPLNKREFITIFGEDYDTKDGTCIRDYIHILDLIDAHILAYDKLSKGMDSDIFNLGSGDGYSVKEMIDAARNVTNIDIKAVTGERRAGDPAKLIASSEKAKKILGWSPKFTKVEDIISSAWTWHMNHPDGFNK